MEQKHFINFKTVLRKNLILRKHNVNNEKVYWTKIKWLQFRKENCMKVFYKYSFNENENFKILDLQRMKNRRSNNDLQLIPLYSQPLALPATKVADLEALFPYIHESSRHFYQQISGNANTRDEIHDSSEEQNKSDSEN